VERFRSFLSGSGLKFTRQRRVIAEVFFGGTGHHSLNELHDLAVVRHRSIGFATVYRTMKLLVEGGFAAEHKFADSGHVRYEPSLDGGHHDHLICVDCGRIFEFEDDHIERWQEMLALSKGFRMVSHRHEIYGSCVDSVCPNRDPSAHRAGEHIGIGRSGLDAS
jgi:Fur family ferric uptake transcriptional regulator